jgi:hypothetical protein
MKKVCNMISPKGNAVPNQFIVTEQNGDVFFQSYSFIIAVERADGSVELDKNKWDCSVTTGEYRSIFLGETKQETKDKIEDGTYKLVNLN